MSDDATETRLEFPDNRLLIDLFGEFNRNLVQIEEALSVQIVHQGNQLALFGDAASVAKAAEVLQALYTRAEAGRDITPGDIDAEIRMGGQVADVGGSPADQMELFQGGRVEIMTRKKLVEPRTEAQRAYVRSLYSNELAFGIGPAGTGKTYLAVAVGVNMFIGGHVDKIVLSRPAVEAGERLGFLPGDM
ncbi:MAG: phosphate starvation-inducible protein PhoH, partial [Boseongicola sp.]|nr:phosphate starvation-inducible protein PhoH [Boseongicola sp.]